MYLNKLLILKKLQQANTHLGLTIGSATTDYTGISRMSAQRAQSYIYGFRGAIAPVAIFDLDKTVISLRRACNVIQLIIQSNGHLLFVNTNPKYNKIIQQTAKFTNQSYINHKWIGGFLTNWNHMQTVQQQFHAVATFTKAYLKEVNRTIRCADPVVPDGPLVAERRTLGKNVNGAVPAGAESSFSLSTLERSSRDPNQARRTIQKVPKVHSDIKNLAVLVTDPRYKKMQKCFEGSLLHKLSRSAPSGTLVPDCVIILNANHNSTAIYEAHLNQIPIISLVDSNIPNELYNLITYPIPANSESVQFIYLFCNCILKTILVSR